MPVFICKMYFLKNAFINDLRAQNMAKSIYLSVK